MRGTSEDSQRHIQTARIRQNVSLSVYFFSSAASSMGGFTSAGPGAPTEIPGIGVIFMVAAHGRRPGAGEELRLAGVHPTVGMPPVAGGGDPDPANATCFLSLFPSCQKGASLHLPSSPPPLKSEFFATSGEAARGQASQAIGGPRVVDPVRRAAFVILHAPSFFASTPPSLPSSFPPPSRLVPLHPPTARFPPLIDITLSGDVEKNPGPPGRRPVAQLFPSPLVDPARPFRCPFASCSGVGFGTKQPLLTHLNNTHHKSGQFAEPSFLSQMSWSQCRRCSLLSSSTTTCAHCPGSHGDGVAPPPLLGAPPSPPVPTSLCSPPLRVAWWSPSCVATCRC